MTASLPEPYETSPSDSEGTAASVEPSGPVSPPTPRAPRAPRKTPARPKASSAAASAGSNEGPDAASPSDRPPPTRPRRPSPLRSLALRVRLARRPQERLRGPPLPASRPLRASPPRVRRRRTRPTDSDTPRTPAASSASTAAKKPAAKRPAAKKPATPRTTAPPRPPRRRSWPRLRPLRRLRFHPARRRRCPTTLSCRASAAAGCGVGE